MSDTGLRLDHLIMSLGTPDFEGVLLREGGELVGMDHCILIHYPENRFNPSTLFSAGKISDTLAQDCASLYDEQLFQYDPNFSHIKSNAASGEPALIQSYADDFQHQRYRDTLLSRCDISEKVSLVSTSKASRYSLNFYRLSSSRAYGAKSLRRLQSASRLIDTVVQKHIRLISGANGRFDLEWVFERLSSRCSCVLTHRELEVCARIVVGYTSESIGLNLNISVNTVLSHRKNAYEKLGIGTQNQLFALVCRSGYIH